jgi:hypothetical protein
VSVAAPADTVYRLVTDLESLARVAEETGSMRWIKGTKAEPGAVFKGTNRNGRHRWTTTCAVTDAEAGHRFAFEVSHTGIPVARWQYDIETTAAGCTVTESTWDRRPRWFARVSVLGTGVADRAGANARHIESTLRRIKQLAETEARSRT